MFDLAISSCIAGYICFRTAGEIAYATASDCLRQGAVISGMIAAHGRPEWPFAAIVECTGPDREIQPLHFVRNDGDTAEIPSDRTLLPGIALSRILTNYE